MQHIVEPAKLAVGTFIFEVQHWSTPSCFSYSRPDERIAMHLIMVHVDLLHHLHLLIFFFFFLLISLFLFLLGLK